LLSEPLLGEILRVPEWAIAGRADAIVTSDPAMLKLRRFEGIELLTLRAFLTRTGAEP
jgi:predicted nucleic acid-binding protein